MAQASRITRVTLQDIRQSYAGCADAPIDGYKFTSTHDNGQKWDHPVFLFPDGLIRIELQNAVTSERGLRGSVMMRRAVALTARLAVSLGLRPRLEGRPGPLPDLD